MSEAQRSQPAAAIAEQRHYPCQCHDWVWRDDRWVLVPRR